MYTLPNKLVQPGCTADTRRVERKRRLEKAGKENESDFRKTVTKRERQTYRMTIILTCRQTDKQIYKQTYRQTDNQI